ncbi:MAG TPA: 1-acyl-sn-glycerol-3-phosphate acyltransferase [Candidatus Dormibacteraeota bacterium]|nr:1-acyl-sn-glycerol-3-phosphate acyltransferase [Candidatus Dormibacteraeota bacterium]
MTRTKTPATPHDEPELPPGLLGGGSPRPGTTYRALRLVWRWCAALLGAHLELEGAENLPRTPGGRRAGGWIAAAVPHRTWIDPFVPWILLPERPRFIFFGDARTMARSPLRRFLVRRLGGVIPIPAERDPRTVEVHLEAARRALAAGGVFMLMPEIGPPSKPGELRRLGGGMAYIALRNRAPIVPLVLGGNDDIYFGRRVILRVLPALDPCELAGLADGEAPPAPGSSAERRAAHMVTAAFADRVAPGVAEVHLLASPPPGTSRRGRFLTTLFR